MKKYLLLGISILVLIANHVDASDLDTSEVDASENRDLAVDAKILGDWALVQRTCTDGRVPRDSFDLRRDSHRLIFEKSGDFQANLTFQRFPQDCTFFSKGTFWTQRNTLVLNTTVLMNNCGQNQTPAREQYTYSVDEIPGEDGTPHKELHIYLSVGINICHEGELLENIYEKKSWEEGGL